MWPWPSDHDAHDPAEWRLVLGRFDETRWRSFFSDLFSEWDLVHNRRTTATVEVSEQRDGAVAVVDIDTAWRRKGSTEEMRWKGRVCKVYSLVGSDWKITMHTGALEYPRHAGLAARSWAETWSRAWPAADIDAIASLYAPDAVFYSHPFRERKSPTEYVAWAFADQAAAECRFGTPIVAGDRAAVDWWGAITARDGSVQTVAGTSLLRFREDGLVVEQRDAWGEADGRHELPDWATTTRSDGRR